MNARQHAPKTTAATAARSLSLTALAVGLAITGARTARGDVSWDGLYHNNTNLDAQTEIVPAELAPGQTNRFREVDYANSRVNVYFLTASPAVTPPNGVDCHVRFYTSQEGEEQADAAWVANVTLTPAAQFHGTPDDVSTNVLDLWKAVWAPPNGFAGTVYYAPQVRDMVDGDVQSLVRDASGGGLPDWGVNDFFWKTNAQHIGGADPSNYDYSFAWTNKLPQNFDGFYFNNPAAGLPEDEPVPGLGPTNFFEYSYDPDVPGYVYTLAPKGGLAAARTRFWFSDGGGEAFRSAQWFANVEISSAAPFHGLPVSGVATMDVWRTPFYAPSGWGTGGTHSVYYATELTVPGNGRTWMAEQLDDTAGADNVTNNWTTNPQLFTSYAPGSDRDWSFTPTAAVARAESLQRDWAYHNNTSLNAQLELVPHMGVTHFLDVDYGATATIFRVLLDNPSIAKVPAEAMNAQVRVWNSYNSTEEWLMMAWKANVALDAAAQFHGLPLSGSKTLDLWTATWQHPTNGVGPVTNQFDVYYAFLLNTEFGSLGYVTDQSYLTASTGSGAGWGTNNYTVNPQLYGPTAVGHDYYYLHKWLDMGDDDNDGMPNWYEEAYLGGKTNGDPNVSNDADTAPNIDEWIADTIPNDADSFFMPLITNFTENGGVVTVNAGPQTSTRRLYDMWWKSNMLDATWTPLGLDVPGNYDRSAVMLTVSNNVPQAFYRSGVKLP